MTRNVFFASVLFAAGCNAGPAGDAFQRAIPTRDTVRIDFERAAGKPASLAGVSQDYLDLADTVDMIDGDIDDTFAALEELSAGVPEVDEPTARQWRDGDRVLRVESEDGRTFALTYGEEDVEIVTGEIDLGDDGEPEAFELDVDLDAEALVTGQVETGTIEITAMPFDGGEREVWYDFVGVAIDGDPPEDSLTTYWVFGEGSGGLEYLADYDGDEATVYTRWDDDGGRYDHYLAFEDPELGPIDEIATNCWLAGGEEVFDAWADFDEQGLVDGALDGYEADCRFGPLDGHPDPGDEFDDLPGEGEWDDLGL